MLETQIADRSQQLRLQQEIPKNKDRRVSIRAQCRAYMRQIAPEARRVDPGEVLFVLLALTVGRGRC